ncbi:hypothetical protein EMPS_04384 [Entomortierella parvispora]|uniref:Uncharacterized protein n=1 Tax=Entomortierella parvispora TaxID=205924 RepID=A0A9P3H8K4_9FUNG|nr:hypothetical protein EMPS_04384 [Entomortierella parvispora]
MDPMERASTRDSNGGGDSSDSDGVANETPRKRQKTQRPQKAHNNSGSEFDFGSDSGSDSGSGSGPGSGYVFESEPESESGPAPERRRPVPERIMRDARPRPPRWTRDDDETPEIESRYPQTVVSRGFKGFENGMAERVLNHLEDSLSRGGEEDEAQREQDLATETRDQGLDDVTLLNLFTAQIKTNLPRGTGKNVVKLIRQKVAQENICRLPQHFDIRKRKRAIPYYTLARVPVYLELKTYRPFDYNHKYDWMSPRSRVRQKNDELHYKFKWTEARVAEAQLSLTADAEEVVTRAKITVERGKRRMRRLDTKYYYAPIDILDRRCNWCGIQIMDFRKRFLLQSALIDVKGVGPIPTLYDLDHEGKPLCYHCVAECGALLKEKRRFQTLYELTSVPEPEGCCHCGIRESVQFNPAFGLIGKTCHDCTVYHLKEARYPLPPRLPKRHFLSLVNAIVDSTDSQGIHWDRVANDALANPRFLYTAQGLLSQWLYRVRYPEPQNYSTYVLLQRNHLTRRSQDWELYTCRAESPTHAALYFARFVALYKKRPMTYLYIRQVEEWNIPPTRTDEWEDLSSGLLTFDQLKNRIRKNLLKNAETTPLDECEEVEAKVVEEVLSNIAQIKENLQSEVVENRVPMRRQDRSMWRVRMKTEFGVANSHLLDQLHWDEEEHRRDLAEFKDYLPEIVKAYPPRKGEKEKVRRRQLRYYGKNTTKAMNEFEERQGVTKGLYGLLPLDRLEDRTPYLPQWAKRNARDIAKKTIADNRLRRIHERHVLYERYRILDHLRQRMSRHNLFKFAQPFGARSLPADISKFTGIDGIKKRNVQDCQVVALSFRGANSDVPFDKPSYHLSRPLDPLRNPNNLRLKLGPRPDLSSDSVRKNYLHGLMEKEKKAAADLDPIVTTLRLNWTYSEPLNFARRQELPDAFESAATPSGQYPVHLLPAEYQVHVFQSVLIPESRTVHVRLIRTERYRRQGDSVQGGGPVQLPSVINSENTRGFYRDSNRAERYKSSIKGPDSTALKTEPEPAVFLRSYVDPKSGQRGVETWLPKKKKEPSAAALPHALRLLRPDSNLDSTDEDESDSEEEVKEDSEKSEAEDENDLEEFNGIPHQVQYEPTIDELSEVTYFEDSQAFSKDRNRRILRQSVQEMDQEVVLPSVLRTVAAYGQLDQYLPPSAALDSDSDEDMDSEDDQPSKIQPLVERELIRYAKLKLAVAKRTPKQYPKTKRLKEEI